VRLPPGVQAAGNKPSGTNDEPELSDWAGETPPFSFGNQASGAPAGHYPKLPGRAADFGYLSRKEAVNQPNQKRSKAQSEKWAPVFGINCAQDLLVKAARLIQIKRTRL